MCASSVDGGFAGDSDSGNGNGNSSLQVYGVRVGDSAESSDSIPRFHQFLRGFPNNSAGVLVLFTSKAHMQRYYSYNMRRGSFANARQCAATSLVHTFTDFVRKDTFSTPLLPPFLRVVLLHKSASSIPEPELAHLFAHVDEYATDATDATDANLTLMESEPLGELSSWWHRYASIIRLFDDLLLGGSSFDTLLREVTHGEIEPMLLSAKRLYDGYLHQVHAYGYHDKTEEYAGVAVGSSPKGSMEASLLQDYPHIVIFHGGQLEYAHMSMYNLMSESASGNTSVHLLLAYTDHTTAGIVRRVSGLQVQNLSSGDTPSNPSSQATSQVSSQVVVHQVPTPGEEFHLMLRRVESLKRRYGANRVGVVALNADSYNWFYNFDKGSSFRLYSGEPLSPTPLYQLLYTLTVPVRQLLQVGGSGISSQRSLSVHMGSKLYIRFLSNPLFANSFDVHSVVSDVINNRIQRVNLLEELRKYSAQSPLFGRIATFLEGMVACVQGVELSSSISQYINGMRELVLYLLGGVLPLDEKSVYLGSRVLYRLAAVELIYNNNKVLFEDGGSDYFLDIFWNSLRQDIWTPEVSRRELSSQVVVAPLEVLSGGDFKAIVVPFMNDDVFPPKKSADVFLNISLRQKLDLPTHPRYVNYLKSQLRTLINSTQECHLSYSDNAHRRRSTFVDELILDGANVDVRRVLPSESLTFMPHRGGVGSPLSYLQGVETVSKTADILTKTKGMKYSPSSINTYNTCPMKFYYQYILGIRKMDGEVDDGVEPHEVGTALHSLMETITVEKVAGMSEYDLAKLFDPQALDLPIKNMQPWDKLKIEADTYTIGYDVHSIMTKRYDEGFRTVGSELDLTAQFHGYTLRGYVDRVEGTPKQVDIIDFKFKKKSGITNISARAISRAQDKRDFEGIKDYQHCIYAILVQSYLTAKGDNRLVEGLYFMTIRERAQLIPYLPKLTKRNCDEYEAIELVEAGLKGLLDEINDPEVPFSKTKRTSTCQQYCPFQLVCGRGVPS